MEISPNTKETNIGDDFAPVEVQPMTEREEKPPKKIATPLLLVIFFLVLIFLIVLVYSFVTEKGFLDNSGEPGTEEQILDCDSDFDCLIKASEDCTPAKVLYTQTTKIFGVTQNTTSYFEIKGLESNKCIFYLRTENIDLEFPEDISQDIVSEQKKVYDEREGKAGTCKFVKEDLTNLLNNWKAGNFSSEDFSPLLCEGEYFGSD